MNTHRKLSIFYFLLFSIQVTFSWATDIKGFNKNSYQQILDANKKIPFLMIMWSIDCPPCYEELRLIGDYKIINPQLKIVLISTDSFLQSEEIKQMLSENHLQDQDLWVFSDVPANQLRYSIDPSWYGELPRSYLFNQCHSRKAVSGKLDVDIIDTFISASFCDE